MEDILIMKRCSSCRKHLTLLESMNTEGTFLVERCLNCGEHPVNEILKLNDTRAEVADVGFLSEEELYEDGE